MARVCSQVAAGTRQASRTSATNSQAYKRTTDCRQFLISYLFHPLPYLQPPRLSILLFSFFHRRTTPVTAKLRPEFSQILKARRRRYVIPIFRTPFLLIFPNFSSLFFQKQIRPDLRDETLRFNNGAIFDQAIPGRRRCANGHIYVYKLPGKIRILGVNGRVMDALKLGKDFFIQKFQFYFIFRRWDFLFFQSCF